MAENYEEYDVGGDNDILIQSLTSEIGGQDGFDCASVDVMLRMARFDLLACFIGSDRKRCCNGRMADPHSPRLPHATTFRDGEIDAVGDILGALVAAGHADWSGEILRMTMLSGQEGTPKGGGDPDYAISAAVLTYLVDMGHLEWARNMCPHVLVYQKDAPADCYDLAFTLGHMVKSRKAKQAAQVLTSGGLFFSSFNHKPCR